MKNNIIYDRELVVRKIKQEFPDDDQDEILKVLDQYGVESYEQERERVQVAIIKLAEGNLEKLKTEVSGAKGDFRDTLGAAEYPEQSRKATWRMKDKEKANKIVESDRKKYLEWLEMGRPE
ncbi:MAG: hypothetical protein KDB79_02150 [Acidobacteria bacterium]|nr:hypothetical protein [Acidobacteriota bacterium]